MVPFSKFLRVRWVSLPEFSLRKEPGKHQVDSVLSAADSTGKRQ
jgi:hypothetical protein